MVITILFKKKLILIFNVNRVPQSTFRTKCPLNLINYPFDEQFCAVKFGSWVHTSDQINITFPGLILILIKFITNLLTNQLR